MQLLELKKNQLIAGEIIVVDDGSQDGTAEIVSELDQIRLIQHGENRGYGAALKTGIRSAKNELICITDADGTYPNEEIPGLLGRLMDGQSDMVVGARTGSEVAIPIVRRPAKWAINKLANYATNMSIPDLNSGLRVFRRSVAFRFLRILPSGFSFTTTITLGMLCNHYLVDYVPIDYRVRIGHSKIRPIRDTLNFVQLVLRVALYFAPLRIFVPVSGLLFLGALIIALVSRFVYGMLADVTTVVVAMTGVQVAVIGMLAELINRRVDNSFRGEDGGTGA